MWSSDSFPHSVASFRYGMCYIPEVLAVMRIHPGQYGRTMSEKGRLEREVIKNMIDLARSEKYQDVFPMFKRTAPFSSHPVETLRVVISDRKYWPFISFKLLKFSLFEILKMGLKKIFPDKMYCIIAGIYKNFIKTIR
jgi:hypothetical protein